MERLYHQSVGHPPAEMERKGRKLSPLLCQHQAVVVPGQFDDDSSRVEEDAKIPTIIIVPHPCKKNKLPNKNPENAVGMMTTFLEQKIDGISCVVAKEEETPLDSPLPCWSAVAMERLHHPKDTSLHHHHRRKVILQCWEHYLELCGNSWTAITEHETSSDSPRAAMTACCWKLWRQVRSMLLDGNVAFTVLENCNNNNNNKEKKTVKEFFGPLINMLDLKGQADDLECLVHECAAILVMHARRLCLNPIRLEEVFVGDMDDVQLSHWKGVALPSARVALMDGQRVPKRQINPRWFRST
jgi:hypothetical protein